MQHYRYRDSRKRRYASSHGRWTWIFFLVISCVVVVGLAVCLIYPLLASREKKPSSDATQVFAPVSAVQTQLEYRTVKYAQDQVHRGELILVNNDNLCQFLEDSNLVSVYEEKGEGYKVSDTTVKVQQSVMAPFNELMRDFQHLTGYDEVMVAS